MKIEKPTVLVSGNCENTDDLKSACRVWQNAHVLHGEQVTIDGMSFYGIGGGIPITPFGSWSYDFSEDEAVQLLKGQVLNSKNPCSQDLPLTPGLISPYSAPIQAIFLTKETITYQKGCSPI